MLLKKHILRCVSLSVLISLFLLSKNAFARTKVACIGDSLTFGTRIEDRDKYSYPAQLQRMLGSDYEVKNFGLPNASAGLSSELPYISSQAFKDAVDYKADIYVLMIGTNDAKKINWDSKQAFVRDYIHLIEAAGARKTILMTAPPAKYDDGVILTDEYTTDEGLQVVNKLIWAVATANDLTVIDNYDFLKVDDPGFYVNDGIHFNEKGAKYLASSVSETISKR